jgi:hypothetical protein
VDDTIAKYALWLPEIEKIRLKYEELARTIKEAIGL